MHRAAHRVLKADPVMAALIEAAGPCRIRSREAQEPFEALARAIAHQQLHGVAAERILGRFVALFAAATFPRPQQVIDAADEQLRAVGFSYAKIAALKDLARKTLEGTVPPAAELALLGDLEIIERLSSVRGIGRWTVEMMLMFQLAATCCRSMTSACETVFASPMDSRACRRLGRWPNLVSDGNPGAASPPGICGAPANSRAMENSPPARCRRV